MVLDARIRGRRTLLLMSTALTVAVAGTASAQDGDNSAATIDEVVVTATRQSETLGRVPISVSAYTQETMDAQGIKNVDDVMRTTPGVTFRSGWQAGFSTISIRGIASTVGAATTGIYIDDTPIQVRTIGFTAANPYPLLFDLERVEVLRGPQGTLFGAGSQGGTVRFITPEPSLNDYSVYLRSELAGTLRGGSTYELGAAVGGPIVEDKVGFRVSGSYRHDGGWVDRSPVGGETERNHNWADAYTFRAALALAPTQNLMITPSIYYQRQDFNGYGMYWEGLSNPGDANYVTGNKVNSSNDNYFVLPALKAELDLGPVTLISNTSYFYRQETLISDYSWLIPGLTGVVVTPENGVTGIPSYINPTLFENDQNVFVQEVRAQSSDPDARLTWVAGAFYSWQRQWALEHVNDPQPQWDLLLAQMPPPLRAYFSANPLVEGKYSYLGTNVSHDQQTAFFADVNFKITPELKLIAGLRYSMSDFDFVQSADGPFNGGATVGGGQKSEKPLTPKVGLSYQMNEDNLFYATVAKGFRVGGANYPLPPACGPFLEAFGLSDGPTSYDSDSVWSYEVGAKNRLLDRRLALDVSVYRIDWTEVQQNVTLACGFNFVTNLGSAVSKGFDLSTQYRPTEDLTLSLVVGYNNAEFAETVYGPAIADGSRPIISRKGVSLGSSPWVVSAAVDYRFDLVQLPAFVRAEYQYNAAQGIVPELDPQSAAYNPRTRRIEQTQLLNLRAGVEVGDWNLAAFANNITNETAIISQNGPYVANTIDQVGSVRPLTVGLQASFRY